MRLERNEHDLWPFVCTLSHSIIALNKIIAYLKIARFDTKDVHPKSSASIVTLTFLHPVIFHSKSRGAHPVLYQAIEVTNHWWFLIVDKNQSIFVSELDSWDEESLDIHKITHTLMLFTFIFLNYSNSLS